MGVDTVVATPHFYAEEVRIEHFLDRRQKAFERVNVLYDRETDLPELRLGAEVYFFPGMGHAKDLPRLCLSGTRVILIEMPFTQWERSVYEEIREIIERQKLHVVIAHLERYQPFQRDRSVWEDVLDLPLTVQVNAGPLLQFSKRRLPLRILSSGLDVIMASDCHNMTSRCPNLEKGREVVRKKMGEEALGRIDFLTESLIKYE